MVNADFMPAARKFRRNRTTQSALNEVVDLLHNVDLVIAQLVQSDANLNDAWMLAAGQGTVLREVARRSSTRWQRKISTDLNEFSCQSLDLVPSLKLLDEGLNWLGVMEPTFLEYCEHLQVLFPLGPPDCR